MLILPATIEGAATRADGTLKITIGVQELSPDQMAGVMLLTRKYCYVALKPEDFGQAEREALEQLKADETAGKTASQRLRAVLYRLWQQNPEGFTDFTAFYMAKMERLINWVKAKLDNGS